MKLSWKKLSVIAAVGATLLLTTAVLVFSQGPQEPPRRGGFGHGPGGQDGPGRRDGFGPLAGLNLTDAQKEQIKKIHESSAESTRQLREQMRTLHENQRDAMTGTFDEAAVRAAAEARAKIQVELEVAHARTRVQVENVLTPEQKAQLAARHQNMRRMGPPKPPPPPGAPQL